jgi:hypothetical protein
MGLLSTIVAGAAGGVVADRVVDAIDPEEESPTVQHLATQTVHDLRERMYEEALVTLRPYPQEWELREYDYCHFSLLLPSQTTTGTSISVAQLRLMVPGLGPITKNISCGWTLLDLPAGTMISTNDSNTYNVLLRFYNHDPLGTSL